MKISIRMKFLMLAIIPMFAVGSITIFISVTSMISEADRRIEATREDLLARKKELLKTHTDIVINTVKKYYSESAGEESRRAALEMIKVQTYGKNGYFWINDFEPKMIMHPFKPSLDGKSLKAFKDPNGVFLFNEMVKKCEKNGEGYVPYMWPKPGFDAPQPKISYVRAFKEWGWIIGSGIYINEIERLVEQEKEKAQKEIISAVFKTIVTTVVLSLVLCILVVLVINRTVYRQIRALIETMAAVEKTSDFRKRTEVYSHDEIGEMGNALNTLLDDLQHSITGVSDTVDAFSKGDLTREVTGNQQGDLLELKNRINLAISLLSKTIQGAIGICEQVYMGSQEVSRSSQVLASGTTEQAATIEQVSSSLTEISDQAKTTAEGSAQAQALSNETLETVRDGNKQMETLAGAMKKIDETTTEVSKIMKVIDDIAAQTNLLSLNAAVEAARAGKYGKGFAVVADEVRSLANRSAEAAKNTTELIENAVKQVENGVANTRKTAEILEKVSASISKVNDLSEKTSQASQNQSSAIGEINEGLEQVNRVVQQNSSISEESASASQELSSQASELQKLMSLFKLKSLDIVTEANILEEELGTEKRYLDDGSLGSLKQD